MAQSAPQPFPQIMVALVACLLRFVWKMRESIIVNMCNYGWVIIIMVNISIAMIILHDQINNDY
jgi:hypothetical protein